MMQLAVDGMTLATGPMAEVLAMVSTNWRSEEPGHGVAADATLAKNSAKIMCIQIDKLSANLNLATDRMDANLCKIQGAKGAVPPVGDGADGGDPGMVGHLLGSGDHSQI